MKAFKVLIPLFVLISTAQAVDLPKNFTFEGTLLNDPSGTPMAGPVNLTIELYNPAGTCLLFQETHSSVALDSGGNFTILIGGGTRASPGVDGGLIWRQIFQNDAMLRNTGTTNCTVGYTPATGDSRKVRVIVDGTTLSPDFALSSVPMASVAESLQGKVAQDFLTVDGTSSMTGPLKIANSNELRMYDTGFYVGFKAPVGLASNTVLVLPNSAGSSGQVLSSDGSGNLSWITPASFSSLNGSTSAAQTLAFGNSGLSPAWNTASNIHTLNIPMASTASVTQGLISNADYVTFNSKQSALGYTPVNKAGDTMTGVLILSADPIAALHAATKQYVDAGDATKLPLTGGVMTGGLQTPAGTAGAPAIKIGGSSTGLYSNAGSTLGLVTSGIERMTINSSGFVGIGTVAPTTELEVNGGAVVGTGTVPDVQIGGPSASPIRAIKSTPAVTFTGLPAPLSFNASATGTWAAGGMGITGQDNVICTPSAGTVGTNKFVHSCYYDGTNVVLNLTCVDGSGCTGISAITWRVTAIMW